MTVAEIPRVNEPIRFKVYGVPVPQGSLRAFNVGGRARVSQGGSAEGRRKLADWRQAIGEEARRALPENTPLLDGPVYVTASFLLPKPKSAPKSRRLTTKKPDLDKLCRSLLDALSGVIFRDDSQVVSLFVTKAYAIEDRPHVEVLVVEANEEAWL